MSTPPIARAAVDPDKIVPDLNSKSLWDQFAGYGFSRGAIRYFPAERLKQTMEMGLAADGVKAWNDLATKLFAQGRTWEHEQSEQEAFEQVLSHGVSLAAGSLPVVGEVKDVQETLTGVDLITGEELEPWEQALTGVLIIVPFASGKLMRTVINSGVNALSHADDVVDAGWAISRTDDVLDVERAAGMARIGDKAEDPMDPVILERIKKSFERQGGVMDAGEDAVRLLNMRGAEAAALNESTILLRPNPSRSAVFVELIHTAQYRRGAIDHSNPVSVIMARLKLSRS